MRTTGVYLAYMRIVSMSNDDKITLKKTFIVVLIEES